MLFLHSWMLLGLLAVAMPIIIHLLNRRRSRDIKWGAMIFLRATFTSRRRSLLIEDVLLLVCRCLAVAFAALALARPFLPAGAGAGWALALPAAVVAFALFAAAAALSSRPDLRRRTIATGAILAIAAAAAVLAERWLDLRSLGGADDRDIAIVIDGSSSMLMETEGKSNFQRALDDAHALVQGAPRGAAFSLVVAGTVSTTDVPVPTTDRQRVLRALNDAKPSFGTLRALDALAVAAASLAQGGNGQKQIVLIGDGQAVGWESDSPEAWASLDEAFKRLPTRPQVLWRRLQLPASIRNASVSGVTLSREIVGTDRPVRIRVDVSNMGTESVTPRAVTLSVDGRDYVDKSIGQIEPGATRSATFSHTFAKPGAALVTASIDAGDELAADDSMARVVHVLDRLRVLVLDGEPNAPALERPGTFAALALRPDADTLDGDAADGQPQGNGAQQNGAPQNGAANDDGGRNLLVDPRVVPAIDADSVADLDSYAAVILADVPRLSPVAAESIAAYVARGGGLVVLSGKRTDAGFYNGWEISDGRVLPLALDESKVAPADGGPTLDLSHSTHPALLALGQATDIDGAPVERWWRLGGADALAKVGARLSDGTPFIAEKKLGRGMVLQLPVSFEPGDGVLVTRRAFVPLVHELVHYAARPMTVDLNIPPARNPVVALGASAAVNGLFARFYDSHSAKEPVARRIDPQVSFSWGGGSPAPGVPSDFFRCEWTGTLRVPATKRYRIHAQGDDRVNVWIDGRQIIANGGTADLDMEAGRPYQFRMEHFEFGGQASVNLMWEAQDVRLTQIPQSAFSPGIDDCTGTELPVDVRRPDGRTMKARCAILGGDVSLKVQGTLDPGVYEVRAASSFPLPLAAPGETSFPLNVVADPSESRIAPLSAAEVDFIQAHVDFRPAASVDDLLAAMRGASFGRELWRPLAALLLAFLIAEPFISRWISVRRRTGEEIGVEFGDY